jgi:5-methylcytosine-specific restriction protein A
MPTAAPKACICQPCPNLAEYRGRCREHARRAEIARGTTTERGYNGDWQRLRNAKLATDPVCQIRTHCKGLVASEVDHIVPIRVRPDLRLEWSNLQSACKRCHSAKTLSEQR